MKRRSPSPAAAQPTATAAPQPPTAAVRTGEHCPQTGWWRPLQAGTAEAGPAASGLPPRFVGQGGVMPAVGGSPSFWLPSGTR